MCLHACPYFNGLASKTYRFKSIIYEQNPDLRPFPMVDLCKTYLVTKGQV